MEEACGRTPGVQQNDGSETYAILQSLLRTHTTDDIELYCDNQGCVNNWDRTMKTQGSVRYWCIDHVIQAFWPVSIIRIKRLTDQMVYSAIQRMIVLFQEDAL